MSEEPKPKKKMTNKTYPQRIPLYDTDEGKRLWLAVARRRQCDIATAARQLVREEARRLGIPLDDEGGAE